MANKFSPSDAAVSVFTFAKLNPKFTIQFCIQIAIVYTLLYWAFISFGGSEFISKMISMARAKSVMSDEEAMELFKLLNWSALAPALIIICIFSNIILTSALRKSVRNQDGRYFGLDFGKDEIQFLIAALIYGFASGIISGIFEAFSGAFKGLAPLLGLVKFILQIYINVRFGMFGILTIANQKSSLLATYKYTKPHFWNLLGAFILSAAIAFIAYIIYFLIASLIVGALTSGLNAGSAQSIKSFINVFVASLGIGFVQLTFVCVGAYAYHQIEAGENKVIDV